MTSYTLDTNVAIYYLKQEKSAIDFFEETTKTFSPLYISTITELELWSFPGMEKDEEKRIDDLLRIFAIIVPDSRIARAGGLLRRRYRLKTPDAIIAATALVTGTVLVTRNIRDFKDIAGLSLREI